MILDVVAIQDWVGGFWKVAIYIFMNKLLQTALLRLLRYGLKFLVPPYFGLGTEVPRHTVEDTLTCQKLTNKQNPTQLLDDPLPNKLDISIIIF